MLSTQLRWLALAAVMRHAAADDQKVLDDDSQCGCFFTNATVPTFYAHHEFFDFRNLTQYAGVPPVRGNETQDTATIVSSDYFKTDEWTKNWGIQTWDNSKGANQGFSGDGTVYMINSANNIYIEENKDDDADSETYLTMRTKRLAHLQTAAEFENKNYNFQYLSMRMYARTLGDPGAVTAMFTYRNSDDPAKVQEADIEVLTRDPKNKISYTNQPDDLPDTGPIPDATRNATIPGGLEWNDWAVHRVDWTPERSVWFVNGQEAANIAFQVPRDASGVNFNSWGDGGSWSGNMTVGGQALFQIQWIELVYNTTDKNVQTYDSRAIAGRSSWTGPHGRLIRRKSHDDECGVVCSIDERADAGSVAMLSNNTESAATRNLMANGKSSMAMYVWAFAVGLPLGLWVL